MTANSRTTAAKSEADAKPDAKSEADTAADTPDEATEAAEPSTNKPIVLSTASDHHFVIPGKKDDGSDDLVVGPAGIALSQAEAKKVREAATHAGVTLTETKKGDN